VAQPQYVAALEWEVSPEIEPGRFTFAPDENSRRIPLRPDAGLLASTQSGGQP